MPPPAQVLDQKASDAAYDGWAPVYDLIFSLPFQPSRLAAAALAARAREILVVGVGTGLELPLLPRAARVTGVDLSRPMLEIARRRVARKGLSADLREMDAQAMSFPDNAFDMTLAPFFLSVAPEPKRALDEMMRVTRPGGDIVVVNHFKGDGGVIALAEKALAGRAAWLGWRPDFSFAVVEEWLAANPQATLKQRRAMAPFGMFTLVQIGKAG